MAEEEVKFLTSGEAAQMLRTICRQPDNAVTVIFGAGASRGYSRNKHPYAPPTVAQLFDDRNAAVSEVLNWDRHKEIRSLKSSIERRIRSFSNDLEKYLSDLYRDNSDNNLFALLIIYLQDLFAFASKNVDLNDNNYKSLANALFDLRGKRPLWFLTFNYDTILEQSIEDLHVYIPRRSFSDGSGYTSAFPKVSKLHGGINFRYVFDTDGDEQLPHHDIFSRMMRDKSETHQVIAADSSMPYMITRRDKLTAGLQYNFPLMMIPVHGEVSPENGYFNKQIGHAREVISNSALVIAIGYNFGDEQFLNSIKAAIKPEAELILVGSSDLVIGPKDHDCYKNISKVWPREKISVFEGDGFQSFTDSL